MAYIECTLSNTNIVVRRAVYRNTNADWRIHTRACPTFLRASKWTREVYCFTNQSQAVQFMATPAC